MKVLEMLNNPNEGMIWDGINAPIRVKFEGKKIYVKKRCNDCGANEVNKKKPECAYCGNKL